MSRRQERRNRPATEAEQAQLREFGERLGEVLDAATPRARRAAAYRMRRLADRIRDPGNLANMTAAELVDHFAETRERPPTGRVGIPQKQHYGVPPGIDGDG